jgi:hypothetical protein
MMHRYLAWQDCPAVETMLDCVTSEAIDLLVMGAYGHGRMRELVFGGFTRHVLNTATPSVLMAHRSPPRPAVNGRHSTDPLGTSQSGGVDAGQRGVDIEVDVIAWDDRAQHSRSIGRANTMPNAGTPWILMFSS